MRKTIIALLTLYAFWIVFDEYMNKQRQLNNMDCIVLFDYIKTDGINTVDPNGTMVVNGDYSESGYNEGGEFDYDHCFNPTYCGNFRWMYIVESTTCFDTITLEACKDTSYFICPVQCEDEGGGIDTLCEKVSCDINGLPLICGDCTTLYATSGGGTPPFTFQWSTGETGSEIEVCALGAYSVTIMDANDCMPTCSFTVLEKESDLSGEITCSP